MDIGFEVVECNLIQSGAFPLEDKACYELPDTAYMSMDAAQPSEIYLVSDFTIQVACETPLPSPGASPADVSIGSTAATDPVDFSSNARAAYEAYMSTYLADSETASLLDEAAFASSARAAYESYTATYVAATTAAGARDETALSSSVRAAYENYTSSYTNAETGTGTAGIEAVATDSVAPTTSSDAGTDESTATTTVAAARETESVTASVGGARREASGVNARARRQEPTVVSLMGKCVVLDHTQLPFECPKRSETIVVDWEIENYVVIGGYKYASIQDDPVDERNATDWDCTVADGAIMPDGWEIAPLDWRSQIAMQMRGFGGEHVILANYKAFSTLTKFEDILPFDGAIEHYDDETR
ncbi:hypothetical protein SARC_01529 [Sphaeroforma arctica JP610]|uniref:Uncharacterized protein n=1 Tax=Sphaeroforma arctica JP610 TaxID=667725 RepID=A0A0L0GBR6_9EUKA|nr:hypothetical protein SARC_01529 [Sphaeroforma arctica JP610]KNC86336.1 hypothetical protein SARC_01529 [Sphaeroforma arctica JP610]|eukprot:XP_014160238.1 hypothetical protein SARC_01529 [Sphaeroforma arctica JP610]